MTTGRINQGAVLIVAVRARESTRDDRQQTVPEIEFHFYIGDWQQAMCALVRVQMHSDNGRTDQNATRFYNTLICICRYKHDNIVLTD